VTGASPIAISTALAVPADPGLPQLETALDPGRMMHLGLLPFPGSVTERDLRVAYVRYKPGTNCIVLYESRQESGPPLWAYSKLFADEPDLKTSDPSRVTVYDPRHRMALMRFPLDLEMPALKMANDPEQAGELLARTVRASRRSRFVEQWGGWEPIRYKPERRCVMRGIYRSPRRNADKNFYARFYAPGEGVRTREWHRYFSNTEALKLRVPRCVGYSAGRRVLLLHGESGKPLQGFFREPQAVLLEAIKTAAAALAHWHTLVPPPDAPPRGSRVAEIRRARLAVDSLLGGLSSASELANELEASVPAAGGARTLIHGDFYYDQILLHRGVTKFLDLDELALGDPVEDIANFCAHVKLLAAQGDLDDSRGDWICSQFLEEYQVAAGQSIPVVSFRWHLSTCLFKLAVLPFRKFIPDWPSRVQAVLDLAGTATGEARC